MALYKPVIADIQTYLAANIGTIIPGGTSANIDWNEGVDFPYASYDKFIQPRIAIPVMTAQEVYKLSVFGQLTINHFEKNGNNLLGAGVADVLNGLFVNEPLTNTAIIRYQRSEIIANEPDPITGHFLTSWRVNFIAEEV